VIGSEDGIARLWDAATGAELAGWLPRHRGSLHDLAFSPDGNMLLAVGGGEESGTICLWQVPRGLSRPFANEGGTLIKTPWALTYTLPWFGRQFVSYSRDASLVLAGSNAAYARIQESATGKPSGAPLRTYWNGVYIAAFSPDGRLVATASQDTEAHGDARLWDAATGQPKGPPLPQLNWAAAMSFSPDGNVLATGGYDAAVHFWDTKTGRRIGTFLRQGAIVQGLAFSPDGKILAAGNAGFTPADDGLSLWEIPARRRIRSPIPRVRALFQFRPDGKILVTASAATLQLWDVASGQEVGPHMRQAAEVNALTFSPDLKLILSGSTDGTARIWDATSGLPVRGPFLHPQRVNAVAFSPDHEGQFILTACGDGSARLWDRATHKRLGPPVLQTRTILAARFRPDGRSFLTSMDEGSTRLWPLPSRLEHDIDSITLRLQVRTNMEMGPGQTLLQLTPGEWGRRCQRLISLEGSLAGAYWNDISETAYHDAHARDAEADNAAFAARWHLDRLIADQMGAPDASASPDAWLLYARRARGFAVAGRFDQAAADDQRARSLDARAEILGWYRHCVVDCIARKQWDALRWYLDRALACAPGDWQLHADRARLLLELGKSEDSEADLRSAITPDADPDVISRLGNDYVRLGQWRKAALAYSRSVEQGPGPYLSWENQTVVFLRVGDRKSYQKLCAGLAGGSYDPPHRFVADAAGWACALGPRAVPDYTRLIERLEESVKATRSSERADYLDTLGAILYRAERCKEAVNRLNESARAREGEGRFETWVFLAMAHHALGDLAPARDALSKVQRSKIDSGHPTENLKRELLRHEAEAVVEGGTPSLVK
jgi:WD40 repeat protein/tetratricopeptide (TPR) repeat protein